ncbi:YbaB/EbfC family nucleoid-associated protein [Lacticaseibacillus sharpeae]|uniref:Nucleoid-associated protein FC18_GL000477 n=1 Tax=Lacticaseibacillus sharpeae JCM 1186 = DSM 20505 TaxID=1291052 RepID=A0A0R1ZIT4_9LACO|nr:YbaB/EbfC family nucleoid-associated protein [Lacticaseibacillus sharpeae]KRM54258.1 hypothetical protein FC18_GL000477 [Lacticaseibacillus sharpeae JCM 1186 = DSM 20505]
MGNMQNMMRQAKKMQKDLENAQKELNASTFTGTSAQDMVTATFTGERKLTELNIKPEAIDPDDPDMVADLVLEAVNNGLAAVEKATQSKMGKYTRGMGF